MPLVSTLSSTAKGAKRFIPHLKSRRNNRRYKETKLHILWTLTFTLWHKSVVLWKGCCLWGLQPARRLFLRSADNTAGALQLPGTPGSRNREIHSDGTTLLLTYSLKGFLKKQFKCRLFGSWVVQNQKLVISITDTQSILAFTTADLTD